MRLLTLLTMLLLAPVLAAQSYTVSEIINDYGNRSYGLNMIYGSPLHFGEFKNPTTGVADTDEGVAADVPLLFNFMFFGQVYDRCNVSTNGFVSFSALTSAHPAAQAALPDAAAPGNFVAALWKDLGVQPLTSNSQSVLYGTDYGTGSGGFVFHLMWQSWPEQGSTAPADANNVIISFYQATGVVEVHYGAPIPCGISSTYGFACGIENAAGTEGFAATPGWTGVNQQGKAYSFAPVVVPLQITTASPLPDGTEGSPYSVQFTATGGTAPYTWQPAGMGTGMPPPAGWVLDSAGLLSAPATAVIAGTFSFEVLLFDSASGFVLGSFTVTVNAASGGPGPGPGGSGGVGAGGGGGGGCTAAGGALAPWCFAALFALARRRRK